MNKTRSMADLLLPEAPRAAPDQPQQQQQQQRQSPSPRLIKQASMAEFFKRIL
jgi:hypothetical protein